MGQWVRVGEFESFCQIAARHGHLDCQAIRDNGRNGAVAGREAQEGDRVWVPDVRPQHHNRAAAARHGFRARAVPIPSIRFVRDTGAARRRDDPTLDSLEISTYKTDMAGADGTGAFPNDTVFAHDAAASADRAAFKIEVDQTRGPATLNVDLYALHPRTAGAGNTVYDRFAAPAGARELRTTVHQIGGTPHYRSCYLRLVVDTVDNAARPTQTLLVSDDFANAPGLEILDQHVLATVEVSTCPAPAAAKCRSRAEVEVGRDRRRIRLLGYVLRSAPGGAGVVTTADVDQRIGVWYRRVWAQVNAAPLTVSPTTLVDPPENLVCISRDLGRRARGVSAITFDVDGGAAGHQLIAVNTRRGEPPLATARRIARAVRAAGYDASYHRNKAPGPHGCADVVITDAGGAHVTIANEASADAVHTIHVGRVNPASFEVSSSAAGTGAGSPHSIGSLHQRACVRNFATRQNRVTFFVAGASIVYDDGTGYSIRGRSGMPSAFENARRRTDPPLRLSTYMIASTMDGTVNNPFTFPHESGHALLDVYHASDNTQLMRAGTSAGNTLDGSKRIARYRVRFDGVPGSPLRQKDRFRSRARPMTTSW